MGNYDDFDKGYQDADTDGFRDPDEGIYQVYVDRAEIKEPKDITKPPRLSLWCKILSGEFEGSMVFPGAPFSHMNMVKGIIAKCGVEVPPNMDAFEEMIRRGDLLDRVLEVKVQRNGEFLNAYIQRFVRMLTKGGGSNDGPPAASDRDEPMLDDAGNVIF